MMWINVVSLLDKPRIVLLVYNRYGHTATRLYVQQNLTTAELFVLLNADYELGSAAVGQALKPRATTKESTPRACFCSELG
jgi:hypothetical protein